ncbi:MULTISPECIES: hypothetical protein [Bacillus cereus group]|nr:MULTISPECIES: hypothetical protein [Bacillus cereus group]MCC2324956.1 hypothetical protein [Bacillus wiedmannii]MED2015552.1 hypothetical protein [Bacillus wiedmannii]
MQTVTSYPWSLRKMFVFFLCLILPPIGAIYPALTGSKNPLYSDNKVIEF